MHNARLNPDPFYVNGVPLPAVYWQGLDTAQSKALYVGPAQGAGYSAAAWAPTSPIAIGGAGMWFTGQALTGIGVTVTTPFGSGKRIVHAAEDVPTLTPGHGLAIRTIATSCRSAFATAGGGTRSVAATGAAIAYAVGMLFGAGNGYRFLLPLRMHDAATFTGAVLTLHIANSHSGLPDLLPKMRIYSLDTQGNLAPLGGGVGSAGWVSLATPSSVGAYNGSTQTITYPINGGAGVVVDRANLSYIAEVVDEGGSHAQAGNAFDMVGCNFTSILDLRPQ